MHARKSVMLMIVMMFAQIIEIHLHCVLHCLCSDSHCCWCRADANGAFALILKEVSCYVAQNPKIMVLRVERAIKDKSIQIH